MMEELALEEEHVVMIPINEERERYLRALNLTLSLTQLLDHQILWSLVFNNKKL